MSFPVLTNDTGLSAILEEDVLTAITLSLSFESEILDLLDGSERLSHVAVAVAFLNPGYSEWRTRAEHSRSPNRMSISRHDEQGFAVVLNPPHRSRASFRQSCSQIAEDLMVLVRRAYRGHSND